MVKHRSLSMILLALVLAVAPAGPAATAIASPPLSNPRPIVAVAAPPVFANSVSWYGFVRFWKGFVNRADRVVLVVGLVAAASLFIITRGKWLK